MFLPGPVRGSVVALCIVLLAVAGCRTHRERDEKKASPDVLYKRARHSLNSNDFNAAITCCKFRFKLGVRANVLVPASTAGLIVGNVCSSDADAGVKLTPNTLKSTKNGC